MNRRGFLKLLGAATAVSAGGILVPEWARARTFFLPPRGGWGSELYPQTRAEFSSLDDHYIDIGYPPGDVRRYGVDPSGRRDSSGAFAAAFRDLNGRDMHVPAGTFLLGGPNPFSWAMP